MNDEVRNNCASWSEAQQKWRIKVQREGVKKEFSSKVKGKKGKQIVNEKADKWLKERTLNGNTTVNILMEQFFEKKSSNIGTSRKRNIESMINKWILPKIGGKQFYNLKNYMFQDILDDMYDAGKAKRYITNTKQLLEEFIKFARRKEVTRLHLDIEVNPKAPPTKKRGSLQPDDLYILFNSDKTIFNRKEITDLYINAYRFFVLTGLRRGELIALTNDCILNGKIIPYYDKKLLNTQGKTFLNVKSSINEYKEVTDGKTINAFRYQELTDVALMVLEQQKKLLKDLSIESEYLFPAANGNFINPNKLSSRFKAYAKYNGLSKDKLHELRHTYISLNKNILDEETMLLNVGHSDKKTNKIYQHTIIDELMNSTNPVDERLKNAMTYGKKMLEY